ncbi:tetratricopeptide repeat protein [Dongia rigui]|uniref:Tetratricopeptide repeat protein n=1 Tax=Dongia rigui TaxID=940149 RepID=A0ABU5DWG8_9PROT|nr:tetratricopeptide repeat protein [Dongia rigui]MDY0871053.1 tetratricopeptide repeat protein [Dongia rigui]
MMLRQATLAALAVLALSTPSAQADGNAGLKAYEAGDYATALKEFVPLAEAGQPSAQAAIGQMYLDGHGVPQDPALAAIWLEKAAGGGNARARAQIGALYATGTGVTQDEMKASYWLLKAANQNVRQSQRFMAQRFYGGLGVPRDLAQSFLYAALAAKQGDPEGQQMVNVLAKEMTPAEQARAQGLLQAWQPTNN